MVNKEQLIAKIAADIVSQPPQNSQMKLSLLQELLICLLPNILCSSVNRQAMHKIRNSSDSEDVCGWLERMLAKYLELPQSRVALGSLSPTELTTDSMVLMEAALTCV
jgi:hypothetical protein